MIANISRTINLPCLANITFTPQDGQSKRRINVRSAFTLFELMLAIALSATLLTLIGTAINLYLIQVDTSREQVEEAQLARSILAMIADDIRATAIYQPQDVSSIAQLMASTAPFDIDSIDDPGTAAFGNSNNVAGMSGNSNSGRASSASGTGGAARTLSSESSAASGSVSELANVSMPLGLNGSLNELYVDVNRLPRRDELFSTVTGYTNAPLPTQPGSIRVGTMNMSSSGTVPPSDLKSVRYFVRRGGQLEAGSTALTVLDDASQQQGAGLVRQEIPRLLRVFAEQTGNSAVLESGQKLVAPEIIHIEFRYFDGSQVVEQWDMGERNSLPLAVEVRIWLSTPDPENPALSYYDWAQKISSARQYRQTVYLPMSIVANAVGSATPSGTTVPASSSGSGSSFDAVPSSENSGVDLNPQ